MRKALTLVGILLVIGGIGGAEISETRMGFWYGTLEAILGLTILYVMLNLETVGNPSWWRRINRRIRFALGLPL